MGGYLRQWTDVTVGLGPFLDDTDSKTAKTALTIAGSDVKLVVQGAASVNSTGATATHRVNGIYGVPLVGTQLGACGETLISVVVAGALPVWDKYWVLEEAVFDGFYTGLAPGYIVNAPVDVNRWMTLTPNALVSGRVDAYVGSMGTTPVTDIQAGLLKPTVAGRTLDVSVTGEAGVDWANVGGQGTTVNLSATTTNVVNTATAVTTVNGLAPNVITAASVATNAIDADALATDAVTELVNGVWNEPTASHTTAGSTGKALIDSVGGGGATAAQVATAVWTDPLASSDFSTASSIGKLLKDDIDATISSRLAPTTAARTLDVSATGEAGVDWANVGGQGTSVNLSATTTNVVNTATAVTTVNGLAANVITASSIASGALTAAKFAAGAFDAVWTVTARILTAATNITSTGGTTVPQTGDSFARIGANGVNLTAIPSVASVTGSVASVTGAVGSVTGNVGGNVTGSVGSVVGNVGGNVIGSVGSLGAQAKLDVNAEVVDTLNVDTYVEPSSPPAATASLAAKINWQQAIARNKIAQTATQQVVRNDADSAAIGTATVSDDGTTATRGKFA